MYRRFLAATAVAATFASGTLVAGSLAALPAAADEIVVSAQTFAQEPLKKVLADFKFTEETGHTVKFESSSAAAEDIAKLTTWFRGKNSPYDVLMASDEVFASFVGNDWLEPLDDVFDKALQDDFPASMGPQLDVWSKKDGKAYRIPMEFAFSIFWQREDLLKKWGVETPKTWDDLKALGEKAKADGVYGFADALGKGGYGYVYIAVLTGQAGGDPFACDDGFRQAIEWTKGMLDAGYMPKSAINMTYDQLNQEYLNGRIATLRQWPYFWSVTHDNKDFYAAGKAEPFLPPAGPANGKVWTGGHGWSIPAFSKHKDAAKAFVKFITRGDVQAALAKQNAFFAVPRKSVMEAMQGDSFMAILEDYLKNDRFAPRPFHPKLVAAQGAVEDAAHAYWTGQMTLNDAQAFCKSQIAALGN